MIAGDLDPSVLARLEELIGCAQVERLIALFRENVRDRQAAALGAFESGDQKAMSVAFHSIKGSAQLVGARRLEAVSATWEEHARRGDVEFVDVALAEIADALWDVERALEALKGLENLESQAAGEGGTESEAGEAG